MNRKTDIPAIIVSLMKERGDTPLPGTDRVDSGTGHGDVLRQAAQDLIDGMRKGDAAAVAEALSVAIEASVGASDQRGPLE